MVSNRAFEQDVVPAQRAEPDSRNPHLAGHVEWHPGDIRQHQIGMHLFEEAPLPIRMGRVGVFEGDVVSQPIIPEGGQRAIHGQRHVGREPDLMMILWQTRPREVF
jgi:hypothetical protein